MSKIKCIQCGKELYRDKRVISNTYDPKTGKPAIHELLVCRSCNKTWDLSQANPYTSNKIKAGNLFIDFCAWISLIYGLINIIKEPMILLGLSLLWLIIYTAWNSAVKNDILIDNSSLRNKMMFFFFLFILIGFVSMISCNPESKNDTNTPPNVEQDNNVKLDNTNEITTTEIQSEVVEVPTESMEEYKASCQEINYKDVLRNPDNFIGQRVKIEIKVSSVHEASWLNNTKYYFGNAYNYDYEEYWGNEYGVYDLRDTSNESWFKILDEDVIMVYGEVAGTEHTKSLILNSQELFVIDMKYAELISE